MKHSKQWILMAGLSSMLLAMPMIPAAEAHDHDSHEHSQDGSMSGMGDDSHDMNDMFLVEKMVDGYKVSFHVMPATQGMNHGASHNLMIKVEEGDTILGDVRINSKVVFPDGKAASKPLMKMGDWYMTAYDLGKPGKYQLLILFKTADGKKHQAGVYYP